MALNESKCSAEAAVRATAGHLSENNRALHCPTETTTRTGFGMNFDRRSRRAVTMLMIGAVIVVLTGLVQCGMG